MKKKKKYPAGIRAASDGGQVPGRQAGGGRPAAGEGDLQRDRGDVLGGAPRGQVAAEILAQRRPQRGTAWTDVPLAAVAAVAAVAENNAAPPGRARHASGAMLDYHRYRGRGHFHLIAAAHTKNAQWIETRLAAMPSRQATGEPGPSR